MGKYYDDYLERVVDFEGSKKSDGEILGYDTGGYWPRKAPEPKPEEPKAEEPKAEKDQP